MKLQRPPTARTFWGVVVQPGKPYVHKPSSQGGRVWIRQPHSVREVDVILPRICCMRAAENCCTIQATLGDNDKLSVSFLECKVGDTGPVRLCVLDNSTNIFTYLLDLEYEIKESVTISVSGNCSIHLWGYYIHPHNSEQSPVDKAASFSRMETWCQNGTSAEKDDVHNKRLIAINDEDDKGDHRLSTSVTRAAKRKCNTTIKEEGLSDNTDDVLPWAKEHSDDSIHMPEYSLFTSKTELQGVKGQNNVAGSSRSARRERVRSELIIKDLKQGTGKIASNGSKVTVQFLGELLDETIVDPPGILKFDLGAGRVIRGWDLGILGMRVGGKRQLLIPPGLAYGDVGLDGKIAPDTWLVYKIELTKVEGRR